LPSDSAGVVAADVTAAGALYFSAAANSGNPNDGQSGTWEGDFADGGAVGDGEMTATAVGATPVGALIELHATGTNRIIRVNRLRVQYRFMDHNLLAKRSVCCTV